MFCSRSDAVAGPLFDCCTIGQMQFTAMETPHCCRSSLSSLPLFSNFAQTNHGLKINIRTNKYLILEPRQLGRPCAPERLQAAAQCF
eukprot:521122-Amphidinium_carterae.1